MEVWSYEQGQDPFNILYMPETTPSALGSLNQEIPDMSNTSPYSPVTGADSSDLGGDGGGGNSSGGILSQVKSAVCSALPSGRATSVSVAAGGIGSVSGSLDMVVNYNSGQTSLFASLRKFRRCSADRFICTHYLLHCGHRRSVDASAVCGCLGGFASVHHP